MEGVAAVKILFVGVSPVLTLLSTCIAIPTFLLLFLQSVNVIQRCQLKRPWNLDWNSSIHPFVLNFVVASISVLTSLGSLAYWAVHMQGDNVVVDRFAQVAGLFEGLYICSQGKCTTISLVYKRCVFRYVRLKHALRLKMSVFLFI